uniref:Uncharacterized protein n=1 Tax=Xenopus tropicalis TaxID=8364 RepID=A0A803K170_XENTR
MPSQNICQRISCPQTTGRFAEDIILSLSNPHISIPNLLKELEQLYQISWYKISASKTQALPINIPTSEIQLMKENLNGGSTL